MASTSRVLTPGSLVNQPKQVDHYSWNYKSHSQLKVLLNTLRSANKPSSLSAQLISRPINNFLLVSSSTNTNNLFLNAFIELLNKLMQFCFLVECVSLLFDSIETLLDAICNPLKLF